MRLNPESYFIGVPESEEIKEKEIKTLALDGLIKDNEPLPDD